jgi:long-subunit fatty acid transport protein
MCIIKRTLVLIIFLLNSSLFGGITNGFDFMKVDFGPRSAAMSGSFLTLRSDVSSIFINPAGLAYAETRQFTFNYTNYLLDINGGLAAYSQEFPRIGRVNFGISYIDYGNFLETDRNANQTGNSFGANDIVLGVGISNHLNDQYSYGINLKYAYSSIQNYNASALAFDFGLIYEAPFEENLYFAVTLLNLGTNFEYYGQQKETLPLSLNIGATKKLEHLPLELALSFRNLTDEAAQFSDYLKRVSLGGEFALSDAIRFRLGYDFRLNESLKSTTDQKFGGLAFGAGIIWKVFRFDYSYSNFSSLGNIHRFGIFGLL